MTTFENCTFLVCDHIPERHKGKAIDGDSKHFKECIFLVEKGNPAVFWIVHKESFIDTLAQLAKDLARRASDFALGEVIVFVSEEDKAQVLKEFLESEGITE